MPVNFINDAYELVDVDSIQEHPDNPRQGDEKQIDSSLRLNKFYGACVVQKSTRFVIVGNHRYRRFKAAGGKQIPVFFADVDDKTAMQIMLADNRSRDLAKGQVYEERLLESLETLAASECGITGTGYIEATLTRLREEMSSPPPPPEDEETEYTAAATCVVNLGPIKFTITKSSYDAWLAPKMRENAFNVKSVAKSVRQDLKLS